MLRRLTPRQHHEVRRQAELWAARLVRDHGRGAQAVIRTILSRPDLDEASRYAGLHTLLAVEAILRARRPVLRGRSGPRTLAMRWRRGFGLIGAILRVLSLGHYRPRPD